MRIRWIPPTPLLPRRKWDLKWIATCSLEIIAQFSLLSSGNWATAGTVPCEQLWIDLYYQLERLKQPITGAHRGYIRLWANLNHSRTGQGQCAANLARWRKIPDPSCSCGAAKQTMRMSHIVNDCPLSRFPGGLTTLHLVGDEAIKWLGMQCKR